MPVHPLAGKPAPPEALIDIARLEREFLSRRPDPANPRERVKFGTSGHRGTPLDGSLTAAHILAITQAICDYRRTSGITGPIYMGKDTHALSSLSQDAALEVLAANGVDTIVQRDEGFTPTPVISRAVIVHNRSRSSNLADGIVITPSHNPPEDGGFKYNPRTAGPPTPTSPAGSRTAPTNYCRRTIGR
jgi:phosphoglucomutase